MKRNNFKPITINIVKILFAIVLIFLILKKIDLNLLKSIFLNARWSYILFQVLAIIFGVIISSLKWKAILDYFLVRFGLFKLVVVYWVSSFFNSFLPTSVGGDIYKYYLLGKGQSTAKMKIASSVVIERGIGFFTLLLVMIISIFFLPNLPKTVLWLNLILLVFALLFVIYFLYLLKKRHQITKQSRFKIINLFIEFCNQILQLSSRRLLVYSFFLSLIFVGLSIVSNYISFLIVGKQLPIVYFLIAVPIINFSKLIPFSIDSIGIREMVGVLVFSSFGVPSESTFAAMVAGRISSYIFNLSGGLIYLIHKFRSKK